MNELRNGRVGLRVGILLMTALLATALSPARAWAAPPFAISATGIKPVPDGRLHLDVSTGLGRSSTIDAQSGTVRLTMGLMKSANLTLEAEQDTATGLFNDGSWTGRSRTVQLEMSGSWNAAPHVDVGPFLGLAVGRVDGTITFGEETAGYEGQETKPYAGDLLYYNVGVRGVASATRWAAAVFRPGSR